MLERGALREAQEAYALCPDKTAPGWSGIGCAELYRHIAGEISLEACREAWLKNTRAYAKRQMTWFRRETGKIPFPPEDIPGMLTACATFLEKKREIFS